MAKKQRRPKKRFMVLLVSVISGVAYLLLDDYEEVIAPVQTPKLGAEEADYYGEGINYQRFTPQGKLQQALTSQSSQHFPSAAISEFSLPVVQATNEDNKTWQIESLTGTMKDHDNLVTFSQNVKIQPLNPDPGQYVLVTTEQLNYQTKEQLATSDQPVTITGETTIVTGIGMSFSVSTEILKLNHQVKTNYAPPSQP